MDLEVPDLLIADELVNITMSHNPCGPQFSPLTFCPLSLCFSIFNTATAQAHFGGELGQRGWGGPPSSGPHDAFPRKPHVPPQLETGSRSSPSVTSLHVAFKGISGFPSYLHFHS